MGWDYRTVTVIGAGVMGTGIAYSAILAGAPTRLADVSEEQLERALHTLRNDLATGIERGKVDPETAEAATSRLMTTTDVMAACEGVDLVIEAVVERMDVKHEVLRSAEAGAPTDAIIATNTSAISITEVIAALDDPSRGVGMHFFNPVPKMRLVELIRGLHTSSETVNRAEAYARAFGKETVLVDDLPGFATTRINALIGNEAMRMLEERVASPEDIDKAVKLGLNHPMGPLEMGDLVGWDTRLDILEYLSSTLGDRFRPTNLHRRLVAGGRHGRKTGRGVYTYGRDGRRTLTKSPPQL